MVYKPTYDWGAPFCVRYMENPKLHTKWGPGPQWFMVLIYKELVTGALVNQLITGGPHIVYSTPSRKKTSN